MAAFDHEGVRDYVLAGQEPEQKAPEGIILSVFKLHKYLHVNCYQLNYSPHSTLSGQVRLDVISSVLNGGPENSANNWKNFALTITIKQFKDKVALCKSTPAHSHGNHKPRALHTTHITCTTRTYVVHTIRTTSHFLHPIPV